MSGVILREAMCAAVTGSSQTVCQIPLVGVYQIPCGLRTCLPRGCVPASVGSHTVTSNSLGSKGYRASVMSNPNPSYPPRCWPISLPLTHTLVSKSAAPKWSRIRRPRQERGTSNERLYQSRSFSETRFITPERPIPRETEPGFGSKIERVPRRPSERWQGPQPVQVQPFLAHHLRRGYSG